MKDLNNSNKLNNKGDLMVKISNPQIDGISLLLIIGGIIILISSKNFAGWILIIIGFIKQISGK